jgi:hypothetical protein
MDPLKKVSNDVTKYFESLGYEVDWDFSAITREKWYELMLDGKLILQLDFNAPLKEFFADLPRFIQGKGGNGPTDYSIRANSDKSLGELYKRMQTSPP